MIHTTQHQQLYVLQYLGTHLATCISLLHVCKAVDAQCCLPAALQVTAVVLKGAQPQVLCSLQCNMSHDTPTLINMSHVTVVGWLLNWVRMCHRTSDGPNTCKKRRTVD